MALTDALSVAMKSLGIAADIYFSKDRTKYDTESGETAAPAAPSAPKAPTPRAAAKAAEILAFDLNTAIKDMEKCTDLASFKAYIKDVKSRLSPEDWEKFRPLGTKKQKELQNEAKAE